MLAANNNPGRCPMPAFGHRRSYFGQQQAPHGGMPPPMPTSFQRAQSMGGGVVGGHPGGHPRFGAAPAVMPHAPRPPTNTVNGPAFGRPPFYQQHQQQQQQQQQQEGGQPLFGAGSRPSFGGGGFRRPQQQQQQQPPPQQLWQGFGQKRRAYDQQQPPPMFGRPVAFGTQQQQQARAPISGGGFGQQQQQQQQQQQPAFGATAAAVPRPLAPANSGGGFGFPPQSSTATATGIAAITPAPTPLFGGLAGGAQPSIWSPTQTSTTGPFQLSSNSNPFASAAASSSLWPSHVQQQQQQQPPEQPLDRRMRELNERLTRMGIAAAALTGPAPASTTAPSAPTQSVGEKEKEKGEAGEEEDDPWLRPVIYVDNEVVAVPAAASASASPFRPLERRLVALAQGAGQPVGLMFGRESEEEQREAVPSSSSSSNSPCLTPLRVASPTPQSPRSNVSSPRAAGITAGTPPPPLTLARRAIRELECLTAAETAASGAPSETPQALVQEYLGEAGGNSSLPSSPVRLVRSVGVAAAAAASPKRGLALRKEQQLGQGEAAAAGEERRGGKRQHSADAF